MVGLSLSAFGPHRLATHPGALGFSATALWAAVGVAAPHGLSACRCKLAAVGFPASFGLPQLASHARTCKIQVPWSILLNMLMCA